MRKPITVLLQPQVLVGAILVLAGLLLSGTTIEHLFGRPTGSLSWGTILFRSLLMLHGALLMGAARWLRHFPHHSAKNAPSTTARTWLILGFITAGSLALRLLGLDSGLWHDEIGTLLDWVRPPLGVALTSLPNQNNHMMFSVLAKLSVSVFGESAWALRLPSVLFGVASVWALFLLGRSVVGERHALLSAALLSVSYHHVWFSQNARGYSGLLFFTILATWLWRDASTRPSAARWLTYSVTVALGMWMHLTMAFVVASHVLISFLSGLLTKKGTPDPSPRWLPLAAYGLSVTLTLQLYALALPEFLTAGLHEVSLPSEWVSPLWLVLETAQGLLTGFSGGIVALGAVVGLIAIAVGASGWLSIFRSDWRMAMAMVLPGVLILLVMIALGHNLWPRFVYFLAGFAVLIFVHGTFTATHSVTARVRAALPGQPTLGWGGSAVYGLMLLASLASLPANYALPKQDYPGALTWVETQRQPDDAVVTAGLASIAYPRYLAPGWIEVGSVSELDDIRAAHSRVWFVYSLRVHMASHHSDLLEILEAQFDTVQVFPGTLSGGEVYVCLDRLSTPGGNTRQSS